MLSRSQLSQLAETLQGIPVWGCLPGSQAQQAGVRYGDILLSVNGVRTTNIADYLRARGLREDGLQIVIFRDGAELQLELSLDAADRRERTRAELEAIASEVVAARMLPTERPPPRSDETPA